MLRLDWSPGSLAAEREDGVPGTGLRRANDGNEYPVRDRTLLSLKSGGRAGAIFPGVFFPQRHVHGAAPDAAALAATGAARSSRDEAVPPRALERPGRP